MYRTILSVVLLLATLPLHAQDEETLLLRFPDLHDDRVVFTYGGDLWIASDQGGEARRLTSHPGLELFAHFSPDGKWIAFTGQYGGDEQVYVMPAAGGEPRQLTAYPAAGPLPPRWGYDHQVHGWTPDGSGVVFRSLRDAHDSSDGQLYVAPVDGGLPTVLPMPQAGSGVYAGDSAILYTPLARDFRTWKRYEGGWAQDLWLFDLERNTARAVTTHPRTDRDPMWIDGMGYFASDRGESGKLNLYRVDPESGAVDALTTHDDWDVRWPADDGVGRIVYTHGGALRILDVATGDDRRLSIRVPDDGVNRRVRTVDVSDRIGSAWLSPTGERVLFYARGDLFNAPVGSGVTRPLTRSSDAHEREAAWSPDGTRLAWISDRDGEEALYIAAADGRGEPRKLPSPPRTRLYAPRFAPDGQHIAYSDKDGFIFVQAVDGGEPESVGRDPSWRNRDYSWSPSGRYLAFSQTRPNQLRALYIHDVRDGETRQISEGLFSEYEPSFSPDGQHLFFLADREFAPQISGREWNFATNRVTGAFAYALTGEAPNPFAPEDPSDAGILDADADDDSDEDNDKNGAADVAIEFDGLARRIIRVPVEASNYQDLWAVEGGLLLAEIDAFYYGRGWSTPPRLKRYDFADDELSTLVDGIGSVDLSADGRKLLTRQGSQWRVHTLGNGKDPVAVPTDGLVAEIDPMAEWETAFDEVWRRFRDFFYVDNMHGYDWEALRDQYRPLLVHVAHRMDLNDILGEMIAELNVSHAYVAGGDLGLPERPDVALLGARFELDDRTGLYRLSTIFDGQNDEPRYRAPLTETGVEASVGDYLLAINGRPLDAGVNPFLRLTGLGDAPIALTLASRADGRDAREVLVRPIDDEQPLHYLAWVRANKAAVEAASDGRLGYLHLPDMGPDGIREFIKWFYGQIDRDGLVIDVRGNGGGNVSQMIIERLARKPLALGYSRTMPEATNYPYQAFRGHLVSLLNENSASDGDIFPYQFRNAGLGPLIGKRSWGGVVGITSHGPLIDGGSVNVPEFGFLNTEGEYVVEGEGVAPDIEIDNDPASVIAGRDRQLETAIEYLLERVAMDPPAAPARPAPPVKTP
ncbi:peptidase S41 [Wenzhouxiangella sp. XN79A]|uniref:S41 family peptidase n=1 Tax=Wenzhouxiangella sp. XN79A TaxID=2724193 RepID=UPI00144AE618|nr:peptidase S41 [Wenzhouxiangella sp. XN79A]